MKTTAAILMLTTLLPAAAVLADDDKCSAPRAQWEPRQAVMQLAEQNGWKVRELEIDDGCYEIEGRDSNGRQLEVKLDPATLRVVEMEYEGDDEDDDDGDGRETAGNPAPAGTLAPPQNGLFGSDTAPTVLVK